MSDKGMVVTIEGINELEELLKNVPKESVSNVEKSLEKSLRDLRGKSASIAPHDLGDLQGSANHGVFVNDDRIEGFVSFDTPYATRQHEELEWKHEPGRQAKYLEQPLKENIDDYIKAIAEAIKGGVKK